MAWERRGKSTYFYRKRRIGQRVVSEYVGTALNAMEIAQLLDIDKEHREVETMLRQTEREWVQSVDRELLDLDVDARRMVAEAMTIAGFHNHKGQWRKRRL